MYYLRELEGLNVQELYEESNLMAMYFADCETLVLNDQGFSIRPSKVYRLPTLQEYCLIEADAVFPGSTGRLLCRYV